MNSKPIKLLGATLLALFFIIGQAYALTMGALGDSLTDEYLGNGVTFSETNLTASNWVQILAQTRSSYINFGALDTNHTVRGEPRNEGYEHNWARSAATALIPGIIDTFSPFVPPNAKIEGTEVGSQAAGLAPAITAGHVDIAFVGIGANDFYVRDGVDGHLPQKTFALDDPDYQAWEANLINKIFGAVDALLGAGDPQIILALAPPGTVDVYARPDLKNAINHVNSQLITGAEARNIGIVNLFAWQNDPRRHDAKGNLLIGDLVIDPFAYVGDRKPGPDAEKFSADEFGHPNTAPCGLMANEVLAALNEHYDTDIPLLTDDEIVALTGHTAVPITSTICMTYKLKAANILCRSYASCNAREMNNSDFDLAACVSMAEARFEWGWDKAEDNAAKKEQDCSTASDSAIEDIILLALKDIHNQIFAGLDLGDRNAINLGKTLLRFVQYYCNSLLMAEANNVIMKNDDKLGEVTSKAEEIFFKRWDWAIKWAGKREVVIFEPYVLADEVAGIAEGMVVGILAGMNL